MRILEEQVAHLVSSLPKNRKLFHHHKERLDESSVLKAGIYTITGMESMMVFL
jgi:hypothetical protein